MPNRARGEGDKGNETAAPTAVGAAINSRSRVGRRLVQNRSGAARHPFEQIGDTGAQQARGLAVEQIVGAAVRLEGAGEQAKPDNENVQRLLRAQDIEEFPQRLADLAGIDARADQVESDRDTIPVRSNNGPDNAVIHVTPPISGMAALGVCKSLTDADDSQAIASGPPELDGAEAGLIREPADSNCDDGGGEIRRASGAAGRRRLGAPRYVTAAAAKGKGAYRVTKSIYRLSALRKKNRRIGTAGRPSPTGGPGEEA